MTGENVLRVGSTSHADATRQRARLALAPRARITVAANFGNSARVPGFEVPGFEVPGFAPDKPDKRRQTYLEYRSDVLFI